MLSTITMLSPIGFLTRTYLLTGRSNMHAYGYLKESLESQGQGPQSEKLGKSIQRQYGKVDGLIWIHPRKLISMFLAGIITVIATIVTYLILSIFLMPLHAIRGIYNEGHEELEEGNQPLSRETSSKDINISDNRASNDKKKEIDPIDVMPNKLSLYPVLVVIGTWLTSFFLFSPVILWHARESLIKDVFFKTAAGFFNIVFENRTFIVTSTALTAMLLLVLFPPAFLAPISAPLIAMGPKLALSLGLDAHWSLSLAAAFTALSTATTLMVFNLTRDVYAFPAKPKQNKREKTTTLSHDHQHQHEHQHNNSHSPHRHGREREREKTQGDKFTQGDRSTSSGGSYPGRLNSSGAGAPLQNPQQQKQRGYSNSRL